MAIIQAAVTVVTTACWERELFKGSNGIILRRVKRDLVDVLNAAWWFWDKSSSSEAF